MKTILRTSAERDISAAAQWYEQQRTGLGEEFVDSVKEAIERISRHPQGYPRVRGRIRRILLSGFPYGVFYFDEPDRAVITGCFHLRRNPRRWSIGR